MLVTIYGPETWAGELDIEVTWAHPASREFGTATINVPRSCSLFALDDEGEARYIYQDGGFRVTLSDADLGVWQGIADVPTINREGMTIQCMALETLVSIRRVASTLRFIAVPAGFIIQRGFEHAFGRVGASYFGKGTFDMSGPLILGYEFTGQYFSDVLSDMMGWTGMEWWLDSDSNFNWGTMGKFYPYPLADDGDVEDGEREGTITEMAVEVTARNDLGMEITVINMNDQAGALWPRQVVISGGDS